MMGLKLFEINSSPGYDFRCGKAWVVGVLVLCCWLVMKFFSYDLSHFENYVQVFVRIGRRENIIHDEFLLTFLVSCGTSMSNECRLFFFNHSRHTAGLQLGMASIAGLPSAFKFVASLFTTRLAPTPYATFMPYRVACSTDTNLGSACPGNQPFAKASHRNCGCQCTMLYRMRCLPPSPRK